MISPVVWGVVGAALAAAARGLMPGRRLKGGPQTPPPPPANLSQQLLPGVPLVESMLLPDVLDQMGLTNAERSIAMDLHTKGFAVFDFPDDEIEARVARIKADLAPSFDFGDWREHDWAANVSLRVQDAWRDHADVRAIAANQQVMDLLSKLYGRRAFPFQTLNFPVGTQQHFHSDSIHFSSVPERFMCGVWLAMEDIHPDAGPLVYYPGSHRWPILQNEMIGKVAGRDRGFLAQEPYEAAWAALIKARGVQPELFTPKKGQALIWAANLLHGGSRQADPQLTRWSQVTHYYFDDCVYYTPAFSDPLAGNLDMRDIVDISTGKRAPNLYVGRPMESEVRARMRGLKQDLKRLVPADSPLRRRRGKTPDGFNAARYLALNPDVAEAGQNAKRHYIEHGRREGRPYR
jgi:hypothetical protein